MSLNILPQTDVLSLSNSIFQETVSFVQVIEQHSESPTYQTENAANKHSENLDILYENLLQKSDAEITDALSILHRHCKENGLLWMWNKLYNNITYRGQQCIVGDKKSALYMIPVNIAVGTAHRNTSFHLTNEHKNEIIRSLYSYELVDTDVKIAILSDLITEDDLPTSIKQHQKITQEFLFKGQCNPLTIPHAWNAATEVCDIDIFSDPEAHCETRYIVLCMSGPFSGFGAVDGIINCLLEDIPMDDDLITLHDSWVDFMQSDLFGEHVSVIVTSPTPLQIAIATAAEMQNDSALDFLMNLLNVEGADLNCTLKIYGDPSQIGDEGMGVMLCISEKASGTLIDMLPYVREKTSYFDMAEIEAITELLVSKGIEVVEPSLDCPGGKIH